ncbi:hypothetical protein DCAR_0933859 [Daucus carota subsp. sativus]|uniref:Uncharacterized protein n=1 Tax=Daucus carota subsp. sativus TaxID=79200 RepID=A0A175YE60_DAUCS|nr:hypothetical protein DCAR_0933859 [Daucus carota subsp. sativus]
MAAITSTLLHSIRCEADSSSSSTTNAAPKQKRLLSVTKPSWIVRTESNVWREKIKKPDPPCVVCRGSGRVDCTQCRGKGRTNEVQSQMLPKGQWPKWCRSCGGSGLGYCPRCVGTGEYRYIMGFHFMNRENSTAQNSENSQGRDTRRKVSFENFLHNDESES